MMKPTLILLVASFLSLVVGDPVYWTATIPNNADGSPTGREFHTLTNIPGTSFNVLFGGVTYNQTFFSLNDTWVLDTNATLWKDLDSPISPPARGYHVAGACGQQVVIFGGQNEAVPRTFFGDVWRFNLSANKWTQDKFVTPSTLIPRSGAAGVVVGDSLYIFGGFAQTLQAVTNDLWSYNLTSKAWSLHSTNAPSTNKPVAREGHSAVYYNDTVRGDSIIFFGGYNGTAGGMSDTWQYVINTTSWVMLTKNGDPSGPSPRWGHSAVLSEDSSIVIFGGSFVGGAINPYYNDVWTLQAIGGGAWNWTQVMQDGDPEGPQRRGGHTSIVSLGRTFVFAGYAIFIGMVNDVWELLNA